MTWQQWLIALWLVVGIAVAIYRVVSNHRHSSVAVTVGILVAIAIEVGIALVLHSGGFW